MSIKRYNPILFFILILALALGAMPLSTAPVSAAPAPVSSDSGGLKVADMLNPDGSLQARGVSGSLDLTGWDVKLDPQRGPIFTNTRSALTYVWKAVGVGTEIQDWVYAIAISGTDVYVGGNFLSLNGGSCGPPTNNNCKHIAKWDGSSWSPLGTGVGQDPTDDLENVQAIQISGTDVYVGGAFKEVQDCSTTPADCKAIAKWDGSSWSPLGIGLNNYVDTIAINGSDVYVGGNFSNVRGLFSLSYLSRIAKWDGSSWSALGRGVEDLKHVLAITISGTGLLVGGDFSKTIQTDGTDCTDCNRIARWDGSTWSGLGIGIDNGDVRAIAITGTDVYAGGWFTSVASCATPADCNRIARWDGSGWSALTHGIDNGYVRAITIQGTDVIVGGTFTSIGSNTEPQIVGCFSPDNCKGIAKWNGAIGWSSLDSGTSAAVNGIVLSGPDIWAVGAFGSAGGASPVNYIAAYAADPEILATTPTEGQNLTSASSTLEVQFNKLVRHDSSAYSATSLANYMLVGTGPNLSFDTEYTSNAICTASHVPVADDVKLAISGIIYDTATDTATLTIAAALPLAAGDYRLYVCGANSIRDTVGDKINGGGNFTLNFKSAGPATATPTRTPTRTPTSNPTSTPTRTPTATPTSGLAASATPTRTPTATPTSGLAASATPTRTLRPSATATSGLPSTATLVATVVKSSFSKLPQTGFRPNSISSLQVQPDSKVYSAYSQLTLSIPDLNVKAEIVGVPLTDGSWDVSWLGDRVGYLAGSAFPTWLGNSVLTGHVWNANNTPGLFYNLKKLKFGDQFSIQTGSMIYVYEVRESLLLGEYDVNTVYKHYADHSWVSLVTCEGFSFTGDKYAHRRLVRAVLVDVR